MGCDNALSPEGVEKYFLNFETPLLYKFIRFIRWLMRGEDFVFLHNNFEGFNLFDMKRVKQIAAKSNDRYLENYLTLCFIKTPEDVVEVSLFQLFNVLKFEIEKYDNDFVIFEKGLAHQLGEEPEFL